MQVSFPAARGYAGMFFVGQRARGGQIERTGTVVLKRRYAIDPATGQLEPTDASVVRTTDLPDNLVVNGDFELTDKQLGGESTTLPGRWTVLAGSVSVLPAAAVDSARGLQVSGVDVDGVTGAIAQTIDFDQPLGGREFTVSLYARTDGAAPVVVPVLAELALVPPATERIAPVTAALDGTMRRFDAHGRWPATVTATSARVVVYGETNPLSVDRVQLEERAAPTRWDPETVLRYESDLAAFKPEADLIVLGYDGAADVVAAVDGADWLKRTIPAGAADKAAFGWESRADPGLRKAAAGTIVVPPRPVPPDTPPTTTLPPDFDNAFYNAFRRDAVILVNGVRAPASFVLPDPRSVIRLTRTAGPGYQVQLRGDVASAVLSTSDSATDDASRWLRTAVPMTLDTILLEPDVDRCELLWRGAWPFDDAPIESYRALTVTASA